MMIDRLKEIRDEQGEENKRSKLKSLFVDVHKNKEIKRIMKSLFLEKSADEERDDLLREVPVVAAMIFIDAVCERDFRVLRKLSPYLLNTTQNLMDVYRGAMKQYYIGNITSLTSNDTMAKELSEHLNSCQKDLINQVNYTGEDVWLLVTFALLKPQTEFLPMTKGWVLKKDSWEGLEFDYNSGIGDLNTFEALKKEIVRSLKSQKTLSSIYNETSVDIEKVFEDAQNKHTQERESMESQNLAFNIINVFAWLPLLLTNIKRVCSGEPMRLFHYEGKDYHQKVVASMVETMNISRDEPDLREDPQDLKNNTA